MPTGTSNFPVTPIRAAQWRMAQREGEGRTAEAVIRRGGKNGSNRGIRHLTTFGEANLQSAPGADNPRYATVAAMWIVNWKQKNVRQNKVFQFIVLPSGESRWIYKQTKKQMQQLRRVKLAWFPRSFNSWLTACSSSPTTRKHLKTFYLQSAFSLVP